MDPSELLRSRTQLRYAQSIHRCGFRSRQAAASEGPVDRVEQLHSRPVDHMVDGYCLRVYWLSLASKPSRARTSRCSGGCL